MLPETDDPASITTEQVSEALGGVEISEQDNVSKVLTAVVEGACEVGTTYYSDTYGYEEDLDILQTVSYDLTGNVIYPIARVAVSYTHLEVYKRQQSVQITAALRRNRRRQGLKILQRRPAACREQRSGRR